MASATTPSFGIKTTPAHVGYDELRRVWLEADEIPEIEHAWLYDHLLPLFGDPSGPVYEGWTLLTALAAQTQRLRLGLLVTNNRTRLPAVLAKIAATVDVISDGRLDFGIGVGGLPKAAMEHPGTNLVAEYQTFDLPVGSWSEAVEAFVQSLVLIRRLWTEGEVNPTPVQRPHPPILIGGTGKATLRIVAEHADIWNAIGPPLNTVASLAERSLVLDEQCAAIGRDPRQITRSAQVVLSYDDPASTRETLRQLLDAGFAHLVLNLPSPFPPKVARWVTDELILPTLAAA